MKTKHNHPLFMIKQTIFMMKQMILPVLAIFFANLKGQEGWGIVIGIGVLLFISFIFAFFSWRNTFYYIENEVLFYQKGVFKKSKQGISIDKITTINENQELMERIFRLSTFKVDAGSVTSGNEIKLTISKKEAEILKAELNASSSELKNKPEDNRKDDNQPLKSEYHISIKELILYAVASNHFFAGLVFVLAVWQVIEDIPFVKTLIEGPAGSWINQHLDATMQGLSVPVIITLVLLILLAYLFFSFLISSVLTVVRYYGFKVKRQGDLIEIMYGLLEKKRYHLSADKITALYVKHGLIGQLCKMGELKIESIGYGDEKGEAAVLYPIIDDEKRDEMIKALLPEYAFEDAICKPPKRALKSFLIKYTSIPFLAAIIVSVTVPYGAFSWIVVALFCITGFVSYRKTRISRTAEQFVIAGGVLGKWTTVIKSSRIQAITTKQSVFQKRSGLVHLEYSYQSNNFGETTGAQFLDQEEVREMMKF